MNSIKNYFVSPLKLDDGKNNVIASNEPATQNGDENGVESPTDIDEDISETSDEAAKARNKKIYFNMESVLKSISKNRRKKKCTKQGKSRTPDKEESGEENDKEPPKKSRKHRKKHGSHRHTVANEVAPQATSDVSSSSPNEKNEKENQVENVSAPVSPKKNIFQVMMNARNKSIGTNSPGKLQSPPDRDPSPSTSKSAETKLKRKQMLEDWAAKKGGLKRKLNEEAEEKYTEKVLERRAKRLKHSLLHPDKVKNGKVAGSIKKKIVVELDPALDGTPPKRNEPVVTETKPKTVEDDFVKVLNSPIKKRDSLLGYYPKVSKQPEEPKAIEVTIVAEAEDVMTPRRSRTKKVKPEILNKDATETSEIVENGTPSSRPKRACTSKVTSYEILDKSPSKSDRTPRGRLRKNVDDEYNAPVNVKLAPLFIKPSPKPVVDPDVLKAKQNFLMSGIPEKMRNEIEKQKVYEDHILNDTPFFPEVSHVQQFDGAMEDEGCSEGSIYLKPEINVELDFTIPSEMPLGSFTELTADDLKVTRRTKLEVLPRSSYSAETVKAFLKQLKEDYGNFPTNRCYRYLNPKSTLVAVMKEAKRKGRKSKGSPKKPLTGNLDDSVEIIEQPRQVFSALNGDQLFSEAFKPASSEEFLINPTPVGQLKTFLTAWQSTVPPKTNGYDLNDDFMVGDSNSRNSGASLVNSIVLCGPHSCGKTSAVYALSGELNFNVLEVNAGNKRTGKKLLQELLEATQSKNVRNNDEAKVDGAEKKRSLILIEDADIVFDADFGFVDAIHQLVTISKRPVVITSNSVTCEHLMRHIEQNRIEFSAPGFDSISKWLSIMCLVENVPMDDRVIRQLYLYNGRDLRRTMMELQIYVQSGGDRPNGDDGPSETGTERRARKRQNKIEKHTGLYDFFTKNQNKPNARNDAYDFDTLRCNMGTVMNVQGVGASSPLEDVVHFYENLTVAEKMRSRDVQDKLVVCQNDEISQELVERCLGYGESRFGFQRAAYDELKRPVQPIEPLLLNDRGLSTRINSLDYQPLLRAICRSEKFRCQNERKRSRFHHHLRHVVETNSFSNNDYDVHCDILQVDLEGGNMP